MPDIYLLPGADLANHASTAVFPFLPTADAGYVPRHKSQDKIDSFSPVETIEGPLIYTQEFLLF